jgi:hypothetical protein
MRVTRVRYYAAFLGVHLTASNPPEKKCQFEFCLHTFQGSDAMDVVSKLADACAQESGSTIKSEPFQWRQARVSPLHLDASVKRVRCSGGEGGNHLLRIRRSAGYCGADYVLIQLARF